MVILLLNWPLTEGLTEGLEAIFNSKSPDRGLEGQG